MAKSSKSSPRKMSSSAKKEDAVVDAEVLKDAETAEAETGTSDAMPIDPVPDAVDEHEPMDSEVEDVETLTASSDDTTEDNEFSRATDQDAAAEDIVPLDETETPEAAEPSPEPAPLAAEQSKAQTGLFPSILGGVIAGGLGFGAAMLIFPDGWRAQDDTLVTNLQSGLAEQQESLSALSDELNEQISALGGRLDDGLGAVSAQVSESAELVTDLTDRLDRLSEGDGTVALPEDVQVLLNAQKDRISALSEEVAGMAAAAKAQMEAAVDQQETAEQAEARVKARAAMQDIRLALISGDPFSDALAEVAPAVDVPAGLEDVASDGVPTQSEVQDAFPAAARAALSKAIREEAGDDTQSRLSLFLKDQLSARSLTPQEGDSADAVLSRAEAALKAENLAGALSEIENLPESAKADFADWKASASARMAALDGFETVSNALNGN